MEAQTVCAVKDILSPVYRSWSLLKSFLAEATTQGKWTQLFLQVITFDKMTKSATNDFKLNSVIKS